MFLLISALIASLLVGAPIAAQATELDVPMPDLVGEPADIAAKALDNMDLKVKFDAKGRAVWKKSNWVVVSQKPKAGAAVEEGDKVTLRVIKKSDVVNEGRAVPLCKRHAEDSGQIPQNVKWPLFDFVASPHDLGIVVRVNGATDDAFKTPVSIRCTYEGTKKDPKLVEFEVLEVF
ncbi:PASTA domain-containing protein [Agromyces mediolanus]|uniref:PASTA domain-containing protein n=1 Tax=Agromyces mediolanus TaxID=41986 RepID=A0A918CMN0_AGRME|nr:PASTA domain-containing protein [Agromyces mediolanus]GGR28957.1 hypothetical protein GCM10010196_23530 [Agromyces mediolanus]GLJ72149.1 hypothetical protein GCM10017583_14050 [Agromyces mediolanus]